MMRFQDLMAYQKAFGLAMQILRFQNHSRQKKNIH